MQEHALIDKEISLFYRVTGEGEPVMLVHGFGEDGSIWDTLIPGLEQDYRLIIPDLPGSGRSTTGNLEGLTIEKLANYLHLIFEKEKIGTCAMVGHSMGGYITLAFAEQYPQLLKKFGLFHSTAFADSEEKKAARDKNIEFIKKHGSAKFLEQAVPNLFAEETVKQNPGLPKEIIARYSNFSPSALVSYTQAMKNRPDRTHVLKNFSRPILFIFGEYDTAVPLEQGLKQCSIPEFAYIYVAAHSGHMGMLEEPEFCLDAVRDFLSGE